MSKRKKGSAETMLELWRPPQGAGDPIGCLATTFTFAPGLFDEQCLARFLEIESEPNREDLAFLLERESRLGSVYAGVLVDYTQAGVEHSLRWDVLPVRVRGGKQHAKISLLAWTRHLRVIVASANLTEPGYRANYEVASTVEITPQDSSQSVLSDSIWFLRSLLKLVPGAGANPPEVERASNFLDQVAKQTKNWKPGKRSSLRQQLAFTLPSMGNQAARSSLDDAIGACRSRGGSPDQAWIASPFFDSNEETSRVATALCKAMARGRKRELWFCVPVIQENNAPKAVPRIAAPKSLLLTPAAYKGEVEVEILPQSDSEKNRRPWHAKMLALRSKACSTLMIGSSNFTCAGMGLANRRNAEANLLLIAEASGSEARRLESVWPEMPRVDDPHSAEWLGAQASQEEEEQAAASPLPGGFLSATYRAGDQRQIVLRFAPEQLPDDWQIKACGIDVRELISASEWSKQGRPAQIELPWEPVQPPEKLVVCWLEYEAFLPLNVDDSRKLPPPARLESMTADDMLMILAATDPSAAFRAWAKKQQPSTDFDPDLDSATPVDLDPLQRYDLHATFLHRIRRRARILAQLRANLQRPLWSRQALEWRLRGLVGIEPLANRLVREFLQSDGAADESLLALADFLIVLREVEYVQNDGALPAADFEKVFRPFLADLAKQLTQRIEPSRDRVSADLMHFWERVLEQCQN